MSDYAVSADGLPIYYDVQGEGSPELVFVHGWCCDRSYWQEQTSYFASEYTVVSLDLGGHGDSGLDRDAWTMAAFGQDVVAVVEKLDLRQVVLIGQSMGGTVVVEAAQQISGRVKGIIGVDTFKSLGQVRTREDVDAENEPFRRDFAQATDDFVHSAMFVPTSDAALVDRIAKDMAAAPPRIGLDAGERLDSHDAALQAGLQKLQVPVMLINSDFQATNKAAAELYGITLDLMSGTGHFVMLEDPETFNRLLKNDLQRLP
jgi:pimeloyl-ACP methyl ester carboxylesterase